MEAVVNAGSGNRRVVEARMSVGQAAVLREALDERVRVREADEAGGKVRRRRSYGHEDEEEEEEADGEWDVDLARLGPEEQMVQMAKRGRGRGGVKGLGGGKKAHLFGRAEALRGAWKEEREVEAMNQRARDRFAGASMVQRWVVFFSFVICLPAPLLFCSRFSPLIFFLCSYGRTIHAHTMTTDTPLPSSSPSWTATRISSRSRIATKMRGSPCAPH